MKILNFENFINEEYSPNLNSDEKLIKLIDNNGNVLDKTGWAAESIGIMDEDGSINYMAGVSEQDNTFYVNISTTKDGVEGCENNNGDFYPIEAGAEYNGEAKFNAQ